MIRNRKGRSGWHPATPKTSKSTCDSTGLTAHIKAVIATLALWGLLPVTVADWLTHRGGQRDV